MQNVRGLGRGQKGHTNNPQRTGTLPLAVRPATDSCTLARASESMQAYDRDTICCALLLRCPAFLKPLSRVSLLPDQPISDTPNDIVLNTQTWRRPPATTGESLAISVPDRRSPVPWAPARAQLGLVGVP